MNAPITTAVAPAGRGSAAEPVRLVPLRRWHEAGREVTACRIEPAPAPVDPAGRWRDAARPFGIPLRIPDPSPPGAALPCAGQLVDLPPGRYDWLYLLLEPDLLPQPDDRVEPDRLWLHYADGVDPEWLHPLPGVPAARLPVARRQTLCRLRLPDRPGLGLLAVTLVGGVPADPAEAADLAGPAEAAVAPDPAAPEGG